MVYKLFDQKTGSGVSVNEKLAGKLHKPVTKKFKRKRVVVRFKDYIWAVDLAEMGHCLLRKKCLIFIICDRCFYQIRLHQICER